MNTSIDANNILIRTMPTPNPFALKFIANVPFKKEGKATFNAGIEAESMPLVRDLFNIEGVRQVHLFENTLSVTHSGDLENDELSEQVCSVIRTRLPVHDASFIAPDEAARAKVKAAKVHENPLLQEIEEILDRTIRPGLQADGGDIEVVGLENNELSIVYQGACGGCPSSMMGTLDAIQGILRHELNLSELTVSPV
jgi:Fe-S cluster biogenesis protein NfuA